MTETSPSGVSFPCHIIAQSTDWGFFFKPSMSNEYNDHADTAELEEGSVKTQLEKGNNKAE
jgi:hypothetical protein